MQDDEEMLPKDGGPIASDELVEGTVYFSVNYADAERLIPVMEALVFIGRDLGLRDSGQVYFQDVWSFKRGVRYGESSSERAQFYSASEKEISHIFAYETAIAKLFKCMYRRRRKGSDEILRQPARGFQQIEDSSHLTLATKSMRSFRFDNADLQAHLIEELLKAGVMLKERPDGAVVCEAEHQRAFASVVTRVRNSCFPWYLSLWQDDPTSALRFWEEMKASGLPFQVEHHDDEIVFLLPKGSEDLHYTVSDRVLTPEEENDENLEEVP